MKIIGIRPTSFKGDSGKTITGLNVYVTYPHEKCDGVCSERVFVLNDKVANWAYKPKVGDEVNVFYNRYGKCDGMTKAQ